MAIKNEKVRIARLSKVTGVNPRSHLFLSAIICHAIERGEIDLHLTPSSTKDYDALQRTTGRKASWRQDLPEVVLFPIDVSRIESEFGFRPRSVMHAFAGIITQTREALISQRVGT